MLPDGWKNWKTCTDDNFYVRLGSDPQRASSYTVDNIESAFKERRDWWAKKSRSNPLWAERVRLAEGALSEARATLTNTDSKRAYDHRLREELAKKEKEDHEKKVKQFLELSVYPPITDGVLTPEEEKNIFYAGHKIGLTDAECKTLIDEALKKYGAVREDFSKSTPANLLEIFKDNVYSAILDGWLEPKETRHLLNTAKKYSIPEDVARKTIEECIKEKGAKRGKPKPSNLPPEMEGKNYYEILGISEDASAKQIQEAYRKQFNVWNSRASNPAFREFVTPAKDELLKARDTLLDDNKRREYNQELKQKDLEEEIIFSPGGAAKPVLEVDKHNISFNEVRLGSVLSGTITISNVGAGTLSGPIKTNKKWLKVSQSNIDTTRHRQEITFYLDPSGLPFGLKDIGTIEIQSNGGTEKVFVDVSIEMPEADLFRFMLGLTIGSLIFGGLFGYFIYNLALYDGMNVDVAGIAGIAALIGAVIAAGKLGYQDEGFGAAFGFGCVTLVALFIIIAILDSYFPHALSVFSWTVAYGSFANLLSTPIRRALWQGKLAVPIVAGTMMLALTVGIICGGFVSAKQERETEIVRAKVVQRAILRARTKLPGEWHGKADKSRAKLVVFREGNKFSGKMVRYWAKSWVEQKLSVNFKNKAGQIVIILKGTSYKQSKGRGNYWLDTFYGTLSPDGRTLKGSYVDTYGNRGKWSVSKLSPRSVRLFVKTEPAGARIRVLNIGPKFYQGMELEAGRYHIEVSKTGCETESRWVELSAGEDIDVQIRLKPKAVSAAKPIYASSKDQLLGKLGLVVQDLTGELVKQFGYRESQGVLVAEVEQGSPAALVGIRPGHLIEEVNRKWVRNMDEFVRALAQSKQTKRVLFRVRDRKFSRYVAIRIK